MMRRPSTSRKSLASNGLIIPFSRHIFKIQRSDLTLTYQNSPFHRVIRAKSIRADEIETAGTADFHGRGGSTRISLTIRSIRANPRLLLLRSCAFRFSRRFRVTSQNSVEGIPDMFEPVFAFDHLKPLGFAAFFARALLPELRI